MLSYFFACSSSSIIPADDIPNNTIEDLTDTPASLNIQLISMLLIDDLEALNLGNFREVLASWDVGFRKDEAMERFENHFLQDQTRLDLSDLQLKTLPAAIVRLHKLEFIHLGSNNFTEFPSQLVTLQKLRLINISDNQLIDLGDSLQSLIKLELLNLANNSLRTVPKYLGHLECLGELVLSGNPLDVDQLPQSLWFIPRVTLGRYLDQQEHMMSIPFEYFSKIFAQKWCSFKEETNAECFKIWLYKLAAIVLAGEVLHQREYFSQRLTCLLNAMTKDSGLRQRCFSCAEEHISTCHNRILFSVFDMECKYLEEEVYQGILSKEKIYSHVEHEAESVETVLGFNTSPHNTLNMPIEINTIVMSYSSVSKATEQAVKQAVKDIENEKEKNMPNILIDYIQQNPFWRHFLYTKHNDFIDRQLAVFGDRMELLEARQDEYNDDDDYLKSIYILEEQRKQTESSIYIILTSEFFHEM
ncbi:hypothetical protein I4U23_022345 [Adineta vaga]|nr:hypothetical protein I4U23_022345 [Adineta vaga]